MSVNNSQLTTSNQNDNSALMLPMSRAQAYIAKSRSENTRRCYRGDVEHFVGWCESKNVPAMPATPATVALYIADLAEVAKVATVTRRLAAISKAHQTAGFDSPCSLKNAAVSEVLAGIRRDKGVAPEGKTPLLTDHVRRIVRALPESLLGLRDTALLLVGFAGGFRRAELASLTCEDVEITREGLVINLRRSKTDQHGLGRKIGIPFGSDPSTCPVRTLENWLQAAAITTGPIFRNVDRHGRIAATALTPQVVRLVVKRSCEAVGLPALEFGAHSLRSGLATQAAMNGASERAIMAQTGHKSVVMVRRYIRDASLFRENAAAQLGL
jgi:integrase